MKDRPPLVGRFKPDAVVIIGASLFAEETVQHRVEQRWPVLGGPVRRLSAAFEGTRGEPAEASDTWRGTAFRILKRTAAGVIGTAPAVSLETAIRASLETLDVLRDQSGLRVIWRLTIGGVRDPKQMDKVP